MALPPKRLQGTPASAITPPFAARRTRAAVAAFLTLNSEHQAQKQLSFAAPTGPAVRPACAPFQESQMPKLKTKSGAKKRFKVTATGKVKYQQSGKRHGMIKRTTKTIREHRGTAVLFKTDGDNIKKYFLPNG
jgi:large subunit ribosomal protein L35